MAISADRVIVELEAKLDRYTANVSNAERHFDRSMKSIQGSATRTEARVTSAFRSMAGAAGITIGTAGVVLAAREFLRYADAAKNLTAQLKLATAQSGTFARAQEDVRRIAADTRSGLSETADLYGNILRNAKDLGITQQEAARATQTVSETFKISGKSAAESAQATRQLVQALQSGVLRGDEFNSMAENAPRLQRLLADSLGVTVGALRAMAEEGELTSDKLISAFTDKRFTTGIDEEFRQLPVTFDQAMTLVDNAAQTTFGAFDRGGEFSTALANFITQGSDGFSDLENEAEALGIEIRSTFAGLYDAFEPLVSGALRAFGIIGGEAQSLSAQISSLLGSVDAVLNFPDQIGNQMEELGRSHLRQALGPLGGLIPKFVPPPPASDFRGRFDRGQRASQERLQRNRAGRIAGEWREGGTFALGAGIGAPPEERSPRRVGGTGGKPRKTGGSRGPSAETLARRAEADRVAEERREQAFQNELAGLNSDFLAARRSITVAADALAQMERDEIELERVKYNDNLESQVSTKKLKQVEAERLERLNNDLAAERTRSVDLREQERQRREAVDIASADIETARDIEQLQGNLADTTAERRDSALKLLAYSIELERLELEGIIASRDATEAQKEIARRRLAKLGDIEAAEREGIEREHEGPLARYRRELERPLSEQLEDLEVNSIRRLGDEFANATAKALGLKGAIGEIVTELIKMVIQQQLILPLLRALGGGEQAGSGGGGIGGIIGSIFGGGGSVSTGGIAGLRGLATGGYIPVGGRPGVDTNVLSINGQPRARVSDTETLAVIPQSSAISHIGGRAASRAGQTVVNQTFVLDARHGITTPQLLEYVNKTAQREAGNAGSAAYQRSMRDAPAAVQTARRYGRA